MGNNMSRVAVFSALNLICSMFLLAYLGAVLNA